MDQYQSISHHIAKAHRNAVILALYIIIMSSLHDLMSMGEMLSLKGEELRQFIREQQRKVHGETDPYAEVLQGMFSMHFINVCHFYTNSYIQCLILFLVM